MSGLRGQEYMDRAIITTSWDDGHLLDLKLAGLLQKYDIPATFYVTIENFERQGMTSQEIREIAQKVNNSQLIRICANNSKKGG